jgi:hypothetical protein
MEIFNDQVTWREGNSAAERAKKQIVEMKAVIASKSRQIPDRPARTAQY